VKSRISSKGQITVPADVRARLGLVTGTAVEFVVREGEVVMRKRREADPIDRAYGQLKLSDRVDVLVDDMRGPRPKRSRSARRRKKR